ncbi:MAG: ROK family protein [Candidatus Omnitrophica bacterium]|nr:ROK family protein [Candidatus Omnitrophota bacterium]
MEKKFILGVDLGATNLRVALFDLGCGIKKKDSFSTVDFRNKEDLIRAIVCGANSIIERSGLERKNILGLGLGVPGPVDVKKGIIHFLPNIPGWRQVRIKKILQERLGMPVSLDNDAKLMCLAEYKLGQARGFKNALCLTLGTGVGGGLVLGGRLYRGADNAAGEIGHIPINGKGPRCNCGGIACLESYIGNHRIMHRAAGVFKRRISLEELSALAKKQNKKALRIWREAAGNLGIALSGVVNLLNLDAIVIGGGVSASGRILFDTVRQTIKRRAMSVQAKRVKVFKTKLGNDAGLIGAAILVKEGRNIL